MLKKKNKGIKKRIGRLSLRKKKNLFKIKRRYNNLKKLLKSDYLISKKYLNIRDKVFNLVYKRVYLMDINMLKNIKKGVKFFFFLGKRFSYDLFKYIKSFKQLIYGINLKRNFRFFIVYFGVNMNYIFKNPINLNFLKLLQTFVIQSKVNLNLKREIAGHKLIKKKLKTYQYFRFKNKLPIRGQRSYANASTSKRL